MTVADERRASVFAALGHPVRIAILRTLSRAGTMSPLDLSRELDVNLGVVSYHVRQLHARGLIRVTRTKQCRGAVQHFYRITALGREADKLARLATTIR